MGFEPYTGKICVGRPEGRGGADGRADSAAAAVNVTENVDVGASGSVSEVADAWLLGDDSATASEVASKNVN